jgi:DNA-binding MarR family transcriptional regulator
MGLGMVMQVLVLAVQNAVEYGDLGVATSGATLFRLVGGSLGVAVLGAIFASRFAANLARAFPGVAQDVEHISPANVLRLGPAARNAYRVAFADSLHTVFLVAAAVAIIGFLLSWLLEERPLRETVAASAGLGEGFAMPCDDDSLAQISHGLSVLMQRDTQRRILERIAERAGVDLGPAACWLLSQIERRPGVPTAELARRYGADPERLSRAQRELETRGLIAPAAPSGYELTPSGREANERLKIARRERLGELLADWSPEEHRQVADILRRYASDVEGEGLSAPRSAGSSGS